MTNWTERLTAKTLNPVVRTRTAYRVWVGFLVAVVAWGVYAYSHQWQDGLVVTAMRDRISWGLYISAFVFFIGISHAGTLISAILRASNAQWRAPVTRMAEFITAVALVCGASFVLIDMGRPDRILNVYWFGRWQSPIMWDVIAITTYLTASVLYLYTPMIPDLALFRDRLTGKVGAVRAWFYRTAALDWSGTPGQRRHLGRAIAVLMVIIIPIAVSVHTVVSWIFGMTLRVGWNTSIFGILFVAGAIFSGIATLLIVMVILRRVYHWEEYLTEKHFLYLGYLLAAMAAIMIYFNVTEYLTAGFKLEEGEEFAFNQLFVQDFAGLFWVYLFLGLVVPVLLMVYPKTRTISGVITAAVLVDIAMFIERYLIVVTGLRVPLMPYEPASYFPSWVEWSILAAGFAFFALVTTLALKLFPMLAVSEMVEEQRHRVAAETAGELLDTGIDLDRLGVVEMEGDA
ncbi:MAG: NrfD/PsrC family molybdoenzyme membrane anchor subunit [Acidimicrobiia bacterium]